MLASTLAFPQVRRAFREPGDPGYGQSWLADRQPCASRSFRRNDHGSERAAAAATVVTATEDAEDADEQTPNRLCDEFPAPIPS
jgi:hypothetical protein